MNFNPGFPIPTIIASGDTSGKTDQAALNSILKKTNSVVELVPGSTYWINSALLPTVSSQIIGNGATIKAAASYPSATMWNLNLGSTTDALNQVLLDNLRFDANYQSAITDAVFLNNVNSGLLNSVGVVGNPSNGITLSSSNGMTLINPYIEAAFNSPNTNSTGSGILDSAGKANTIVGGWSFDCAIGINCNGSINFKAYGTVVQTNTTADVYIQNVARGISLYSLWYENSPIGVNIADNTTKTDVLISNPYFESDVTTSVQTSHVTGLALGYGGYYHSLAASTSALSFDVNSSSIVVDNFDMANVTVTNNSTSVVFLNCPNFNPKGKITNPFDNTNFIISPFGVAALPTSTANDYIITGTDMAIVDTTANGGTLTLKDNAANSLATGYNSTSIPLIATVGQKIRFVTALPTAIAVSGK